MSLLHKPFYFVRHGQTDWNKEHRAQGQIDIPLNATGLEQAHLAAQQLLTLPCTAIITSPLQRALQTAQIIGQATGKTITIVEEFKECSWGIMEGECKGDGGWMQRWRNGASIQEAEHKQDFVARVSRGLTKSLEAADLPLIVAHGGVYWAIQEILQLPNIEIANCCILSYEPSFDPIASWKTKELRNSLEYRF